MTTRPRLRIGFFSGTVDRPSSSQMVVLPLARALKSLGHDIYALKPTRIRTGITLFSDIRIASMPTYPLLLKRWDMVHDLILFQVNKARKVSIQDSVLNPYYLAVLGQLQIQFVQDYDLDVLYSFHNVHTVGPLLTGVPKKPFVYIMNLIGFGIDQTRGGVEETFRYQDVIFKHPCWDLQITATPSEYDQYQLVYQALELDQDRLTFLPHPVDDTIFRPLPKLELSDFRHRINLGGKKKCLGFPVPVYRRKNIELAIQILSQLPKDVCLIVSGPIWDEKYHQELENLARELGLGDRVSYLHGQLEFAEMPLFYNVIDLTIYTSYQETYGIGLVESLACGTSAVGPSWIQPCVDILRDQRGGWLIEKDPIDAARTIQLALDNEEDRQEVSSDCMRRFGATQLARELQDRAYAILKKKLDYGLRVEMIDWKSLYQDSVVVPEQLKNSVRG